MNLCVVCVLLLLAQRSLCAVREIYIAAVEIGWDYNHMTNLESHSQLSKRLSATKDGLPQYMKAVYWEYTDSTFSTPKVKPPWMGIQGPIIRAEVNDRVVAHFKNFASHPYSIFPIGVSYWKQSEGDGYDDSTSAREKEDDVVSPGGYYRYVWDILASNGPTLMDPDCLTYSYTSHVDVVNDLNSGLLGALLVCKAGSLKSDGQQKVPEYVLFFAVFDETKSWYGNVESSAESIPMSKTRKQFHTINGYVNSTLPGLKMCQKKSVFWHLIGMGTSSDVHSIHFHEHTLQVMKHRKVLLEVTPMTFATAEMKPVAAGKFLISCEIPTHQLDGMNAHFTVEDCPQPIVPVLTKSFESNDYEYDIALEELVTKYELKPGITGRSSVKLIPKLWVHYIAAEEVTWDYAPELSQKHRSSKYITRSQHHIGKVYKKAVYVEYTDESFTQRKTANRGLLGPVLRGEVEDKFKIVFKNMASRPFNIYPNGLTNISAPSLQESSKDLRNYAIKPNETFTYIWAITPEDGPTKSDPRCLTRLYRSTIEPVRDLASGLVGPLVLCYRRTLDKRGNVLMSDKDKHLVFTVFDENKSWYFDENVKKYSQDPSKVNSTDPEFYSSNVMYNVNGFMFNNLRFQACLGDVTFWHVLNVGSQSSFLSVYFTGNTFERDKVYETVLTLFPMSGETISMEMETVGEWEISAFDTQIKNRGMSARYTVLRCEKNLPLADDEDYYDFEDYLENTPRSTRGMNRTLAIKVCKKPINMETQRDGDSGQTTCVIKHITLTGDSGVEPVSEGDIPNDILQELDEMSRSKSVEDHSTQSPKSEALLTESGNTIGMGIHRRRRRRSLFFSVGVKQSDSKTSEEGQKNDNALPNSGKYKRSEYSLEGDFGEQPATASEVVKNYDQGLAFGAMLHPKGKREAHREGTSGTANESQQEENFLGEETGSSVSHDVYGYKVSARSVHDLDSNSTQSNVILEYDDYSVEVKTNGTEPEEDFNVRATEGKYRSYYIAAEEIVWDYGLKKPQQVISGRQMRKGIRKYLPEYKKVVFRAYLDQDFKYRATRGELEEHLGIMGPVIKAEINDFVTVTFKNMASRPYSFHIHGVFDRSQGVEFGEAVEEAVQPNEVRVYNWKITKRQGPSPKDFDCKAWTYYSSLNTEKDINSGLVGPLVVCKPGTLYSARNIDTQEFYLLFMVFDETKSWYFEQNLKEFCRPPCHVNKDDPWFEIFNKFAAINGYVAETLPGLMMAQYSQVRWHLLNMGSRGEFHAVHFHGLPFTVRINQEHRMGVYNLYPGVFGTVEMQPTMVGSWMVECSIGEHQLSGMRAKLLVYDPKCSGALGMRTGRIADDQITDSDHYGDWEARLARLELSGSINAWSGQSQASWIQVDLLRPTLIHGIRTQGATHGLSESFVVLFTLSYSHDKETWKTYKGNSTKQDQLFNGNIDGSRIRDNFFSPPILGRYIRVKPLTFQRRPTLRFELYGCDVNSCSTPLGMEKMLIPNSRISASSFLQNVFLSWSPSLARLNNEGRANAWRPKTSNPYEWIQVDFQEVKRVTGVLTQGARSMLTHMMVTEFTVSLSSDGRTWTSQLEENTPREKVYHGNTRYNEEVLNVFEPPLFTRYIRIHPKGWYNDIAVRLEFLGCSTQQ